MRSKVAFAASSLIALSVLFACDVLAQQPSAAPTHSGTHVLSYLFEPTGQQMKYVVHLPRKFDAKKPMPLVIVLHGYGGQPENIISAYGPAADKHGYILAAPMGYIPGGWYGFSRNGVEPVDPETARRSELDVMNVLGMMRTTYNIDPRRVYVAGHSMGGFGAVYLAVKHPEIWAAVGATSPGFIPEALQVQGLGAYAAAPIIVEHGELDQSTPASLVRSWVAGVRERKVPVTYNEHRGGGHNAPLQGGGPARVLEFFGKHSRPQEIAAP
jgi:poly(3-hydroxybutyrate) depolymerase